MLPCQKEGREKSIPTAGFHLYESLEKANYNWEKKRI